MATIVSSFAETVASNPVRAGLTLALAGWAAIYLSSAVYAGPGGGPAGPSTAVSFEEIPGSKLKRVILTQKAAERLGIEIGEISEKTIARKQVVGGKAIPTLGPQEGDEVAEADGGVGFGSFATPVSTGSTSTGTTVDAPPIDPTPRLVWVTLSPEEWERTRQDAPARIMRLQTRDGEPFMATPSNREPQLDPKRTMLSVFYEIANAPQALQMNERVRVELTLTDDGRTEKVAPYSSIYYDGEGKPWVYVNSKPLTYERAPVSIARIEGDWAVLSDGPPLGTQVVTVGSPLLYGAEVIYKR